MYRAQAVLAQSGGLAATYYDGVGLLNAMLNIFGVEPIEWLATTWLAIPILIFMSLWGGAGFGMILF